MSAVRAFQEPAPVTAKPDRRRWVALAFIAVAQLMIALDATIVSIALPSAQRALGASDADRQWVVTAYTLTFGGLLLLGGRIADYVGRKRAFIVGLAGFALASMLGGAAPDFAVLVAARALQGAFAALLAPTALSLLAVSFTEARERATAFVVYGSIAGSGAAIGLLLGGVLTQYLEWRWCLYVNVPIAVAAAIGAAVVISGAAGGARPKVDVPGAVLVTGGLVALVYACTEVVRSGWLASTTVVLLAVSAVLLILFMIREARTANPLLPLRIVADRNRGGAFAAVALVTAGMFGAYLFLTYYLQAVLHYTPLQAGLAFLPVTIASQSSSWLIARRLMPRVPARLLIASGAAVAAAGVALLTQLHVDSAYWMVVLPAEILLGTGLSTAMSPAFSVATRNVDPREAGIASAGVNASAQVGASLGTAVLNTIAASASAGFVGPRAAALVHGFAVATGWGAGVMLAGAVAGLVLLTTPGPDRERVTRS